MAARTHTHTLQVGKVLVSGYPTRTRARVCERESCAFSRGERCSNEQLRGTHFPLLLSDECLPRENERTLTRIVYLCLLRFDGTTCDLWHQRENSMLLYFCCCVGECISEDVCTFSDVLFVYILICDGQIGSQITRS